MSQSLSLFVTTTINDDLDQLQPELKSGLEINFHGVYSKRSERGKKYVAQLPSELYFRLLLYKMDEISNMYI